MGSRVLAIVCASGCGFHPGVAVDSADSPLDDASLRADGAAIDGKLAVDPALVQQKSNSATSGSPLSVTLAAPPTAGNVLLMIGAANSGGLTSVTGGGVATWTLVTSSLSYANIEIWFGVNERVQLDDHDREAVESLFDLADGQ